MLLKEWDNFIAKEASELNLNRNDSIFAYKSLFRFIQHKAKEFPSFHDITGEELNSLKTNFNIPYIGKFFVDEEIIKRKLNYINKRKNIKNGF